MKNKQYVVVQKPQEIDLLSFKDGYLTAINLCYELSTKGVSIPQSLQIIKIIQHGLDTNNIYGSNVKYIAKTLDISERYIYNIFKVLEEINFWYKDPDSRGVYFVNPSYYTKTSRENYRQMLFEAYKESKEVKKIQVIKRNKKVKEI